MSPKSPKARLFVQLQGPPGVGKSKQLGFLTRAALGPSVLDSIPSTRYNSKYLNTDVTAYIRKTLKSYFLSFPWLKNPNDTVTVDADTIRSSIRGAFNQFLNEDLYSSLGLLPLSKSIVGVLEKEDPTDISTFVTQAEILKEALRSAIIRKLYYEEKNVIAEGSFFLPSINYAPPISEELEEKLAYPDDWERVRNRIEERDSDKIVRVPIMLTQGPKVIEKRLKERDRITTNNTKEEIERIMSMHQWLLQQSEENGIPIIKSTTLQATAKKIIDEVKKAYKAQIAA